MSTILHSQDRPRVLEHVGGNVRRYRQTRAMSQEALSAASGVSRRMIVGIEGGDANVSLGTLDRLAEALGIRFADLVQSPTPADPARIEAMAWAGQSAESNGTLLSSHAVQREVEIWRWSLAPGESYDTMCNYADWTETMHVIEGEVAIDFPDGARTVTAGDFHSFTCDQPRRFHNPGTSVARFLRVLTH